MAAAPLYTLVTDAQRAEWDALGLAHFLNDGRKRPDQVAAITHLCEQGRLVGVDRLHLKLCAAHAVQHGSIAMLRAALAALEPWSETSMPPGPGLSMREVRRGNMGRRYRRRALLHKFDGLGPLLAAACACGHAEIAQELGGRISVSRMLPHAVQRSCRQHLLRTLIKRTKDTDNARAAWTMLCGVLRLHRAHMAMLQRWLLKAAAMEDSVPFALLALQRLDDMQPPGPLDVDYDAMWDVFEDDVAQWRAWWVVRCLQQDAQLCHAWAFVACVLRHMQSLGVDVTAWPRQGKSPVATLAWSAVCEDFAAWPCARSTLEDVLLPALHDTQGLIELMLHAAGRSCWEGAVATQARLLSLHGGPCSDVSRSVMARLQECTSVWQQPRVLGPLMQTVWPLLLLAEREAAMAAGKTVWSCLSHCWLPI